MQLKQKRGVRVENDKVGRIHTMLECLTTAVRLIRRLAVADVGNEFQLKDIKGNTREDNQGPIVRTYLYCY